MLGVVGIAAGGGAFLLLVALVRRHPWNIWMVGGDILFGSTAAYLVYRGVLAARGMDYSKRAGPRFGWGRLLVGSWILLSNTFGRVSAPLNTLKPSNETQAVAMKTTEGMLLLGAGCLIVWGIANGIRSWRQ